MVMPSSAITRYDLSMPFTEFDLMMNQKGFIGPQVLRPRLVGVQAADVGKIPIEALLQQHKTKRASGAGYRRGDFEFGKYNYATNEYGWEEPLDDRTLAIYADIIDAEDVHSMRAMGFVADEFERDVAAAIYDTATWTGAALTTTITNEWDDWSNATPIQDVHNAKEKVRTGSGLEPNALILNSWQLFNLCNCAQIVDRVKYVQRADQASMLAAVADVLGVRHLLSAGGFTNTANPQQTAAISRIWSNEYMMVARVAETADPQEPCVGRTFIWTGDGPGAVGSDENLAMVVEEYREEGVRGGVLRARNDRDIVIMYPEAAHLLSNAITI